MIITETNRYAEQQPSNSTQNLRQSVALNDKMIFLAINILKEIVKRLHERMYWYSAEILSTPKHMSQRRYLQIEKNLHFCHNEENYPFTHPNPKLKKKIWTVLENINKKCLTVLV